MDFIYNILAKKYGDGSKAKSRYRAVKCVVSAVLGIGVALAIALVSHFTLRDNTVWYIVAGCIFAYTVYAVIDAIRDPMLSLHASPDVKKAEELLMQYGAMPEWKDLYGKNIGKVVFDNDAPVEMTYADFSYIFTVKNDEWDVVETVVASDMADFLDSLKKAADIASSLEKAPEGEYDDTAPEEDGTEEYDEEYEEEEAEAQEEE